MQCQGYLFSMSTIHFQLSQWLASAGFANFFFVFGVYPKLENFGVCQFSSSKHDKTLQDLIFLWRGKSRFVELGVSNLFSFAPSTSNLRTSMLCQGYLFSMSTIHCAIFAVTGFCRICQSSLFSQVSALGVHLDNFVSNAMPGLLVVHVHHTFSAFTVTGFCRICQLFLSLVSTPNLRTLVSVSFHPPNMTKICRIWFFLWRG